MSEGGEMEELKNKKQVPTALVGSVGRSAISGRRTPYKTPRLTVFGQVSKLTQNGTGTGTDGGSVGMSMQCL
jgi:hypothetical protein